MTDHVYCENKANSFLNHIFTRENIEKNLVMVKETCEVLATASYSRGICGSDPSTDDLGKYIRYICYWLENSEEVIISRDFAAVKSLR